MKITSYVKKIKVKGNYGHTYRNVVWTIDVTLYDGRSCHYKTNGKMLMGEISETLVSALEAQKGAIR